MIFPTAITRSRVPSEHGSDNPPPTDEKPIDEVYHDRNLLAIAELVIRPSLEDVEDIDRFVLLIPLFASRLDEDSVGY
ncbi:hypothetical protein Natpe_2815 [Natrinema pellirubrum DSM 15624]|uniref:Uncharacterized protein n=1 Tax=Natrinema pellirubrum (strain DSM 15624 / CIP 106293 / JCM 10476 / NCIMB 786 / 157) TaxID=797303 RepID=L0JMX1_NATP1|nr:hypothetical protein Natpe_2815 [Natrinema pellirubrum DSM 15624]